MVLQENSIRLGPFRVPPGSAMSQFDVVVDQDAVVPNRDARITRFVALVVVARATLYAVKFAPALYYPIRTATRNR